MNSDAFATFFFSSLCLYCSQRGWSVFVLNACQKSFFLLCLRLKVQCTMSQGRKLSVQTRLCGESLRMLTIGLEYAHVGSSLRTFLSHVIRGSYQGSILRDGERHWQTEPLHAHTSTVTYHLGPLEPIVFGPLSGSGSRNLPNFSPTYGIAGKNVTTIWPLTTVRLPDLTLDQPPRSLPAATQDEEELSVGCWNESRKIGHKADCGRVCKACQSFFK